MRPAMSPTVPPSGPHETLPPPTSPAARTAWSAANLTSAAIERDAVKTFQRFRWRRDPDIGLALRLGLGALVIPLVAPLAWSITAAELAAIDSGHVARRGRGWIVFAKLCSVAATCALAATTIAAVIVAL